MPTEARKRCIELIRVSTAGQAADDRASIPAQRAVNRRTAAQHGLQIVRTIQISDVSGANVLRSPEMQELLRLIQNPEIVGVVAREFSRLMRPDNYDDLSLLQRFVDSQTDIYLPEGRVDPSDLLLTMVRAGVAGKERKEMLERAWTAKEEKRKRGELAQSRIVLPWGVDYENGKWGYKPEAAVKVRRAYKQVLSGEINYNRIAAQLDVTPRGAALILQNPIWKGWRILDKKRDPSANGRYGGKDGRQADRRKIARAASEIIRVRVIDRPLLSESEWDRAQQIMARKATLHWRNRGAAPRFTYAGFLRCTKCGGPVHTALARRDYYVCKAARLKPHSCDTHYMERVTLENKIDEFIGKQLLSPQFLARSLAALRREQENKRGARDVPRLEDALARLEAKRTRIIDAFFEELLTKQDRDRRLETVDRDLATTRNQLAEVAGQPTGLTPADLKKLLEPLAEWKWWNYTQKRRMLALLAPTIRVVGLRGTPRVTHLGLNLGGSVTNTRTDRGSWRRPA
jgi:DNA invertase Pin-like site-specific DNA recombinase